MTLSETLLLVLALFGATANAASPVDATTVILLADACLKLWGYESLAVLSGAGGADSDVDYAGWGQQPGGTVDYVDAPSIDLVAEEIMMRQNASNNILVASLRPFSASDLKLLAGNGLFSKIAWLIPVQGTDIPRDLTLRLDSQVFLYDWSSYKGLVNVTEIYAIKGGRHRVNYVGQFSNGSGLVVPQKSMYERRRDMSGVTLINSVLSWDPICILHKFGNGTILADGYFASIYKMLEKLLGFNTINTVPPDGLYGATSNGSWNGIVGQLQGGSVDVSTAGLGVTKERSTVCDFTTGLVYNVNGLIVRLQDQVATNYWVYVDIFLVTLWAGIGVIVAMLAAGFFAVALFGVDGIHSQQDSERFGLLNALSLVTLIFLQRDYPVMVKAIPTRILYLITCLSAFIVFAFYTAVLTSVMTAQEKPAPMTTFQDALDRDYKVHYWVGTVVEDYLRSFPAGTAGREVFDLANEKGYHVRTNEEIVQLLKVRNDVAYFDAFTTFVHMPFIETINIAENLKVVSGFALQKDSELKAMFNYHLGKIKTSGLLEKENLRWLTAPPNENFAATPATVLDYHHLVFPFCVLALGAAAAALSVLTERMAGLCGLEPHDNKRKKGAGGDFEQHYFH